METFEPFVAPTNRGKIVLPDFDTLLRPTEPQREVPVSEPQEMAAGPKPKKSKAKIDIDIEKLRKSDKKQGYDMASLKNFAKSLNKAGFSIQLTGVKKADLAQAILNALED